MPDAVTDDRAPSDRIDPAVVRLGLVLATGALAVAFDTTIVSVALQILADELEVSVATIQWAMTGYVLALGMAVPLSTWAIGRLGGRRTWFFALGLFLVASVGAAMAWNAASLIGWRIIQGLGGGLLMPTMGTLMMQAAAGRAMGRTVSLAMLPLTVGPIAGPFVGGVILTHLDWRFMFWINVPLCATGLALAAIFLPTDPTPSARPKLDVGGFALLAPAVGALLLGLTNAGRLGSFAQASVLVPTCAGAALLVAFVAHTLRRVDPLVDLRLLRHRSLASASSVLFFNAMAIYGPLLLIPIYYLQGRGATALSAGVMLMPEAIGTALGLSAAGLLTDKLGARRAAVGATALVTAATVPFIVVTAHTAGWMVALVLLVRGVGLGAVGVPAMAGAYRGLDRDAVGHATVLTRTIVQVGGALGTAVLAVILVRTTASHDGDVMAGINAAFGWSVAFGVAALGLTFWLPGRRGTASGCDAA